MTPQIHGVVGVDVREATVAALQPPRDYPAVSILMPTHRRLPNNPQDYIRLRNLLGDARARLTAAAGTQAARALEQLERAVEEVDLARVLDGLAVFATATERHIVYLPIPVRARVIVDTSFATRDLVRSLQLNPRYWVLVLSDRATRLFEGVGGHLIEITTTGFPLLNGHGDEPLPRDFGQEPSAHRIARRRAHFRRVDQAFAPLAAEQPLPVIVVGVARSLAFLDEVSRHRHLVIGQVVGGHDSTPAHHLGELVRPVVDDLVADSRRAALAELQHAVKERRYAGGLNEVRELIDQGRGAHLLVEEHLGVGHSPAEEQSAHPHDRSPDGDPVDDVVEAALDKKGRVTFVGDGTLRARGRIAVVLRY